MRWTLRWSFFGEVFITVAAFFLQYAVCRHGTPRRTANEVVACYHGWASGFRGVLAMVSSLYAVSLLQWLGQGCTGLLAINFFVFLLLGGQQFESHPRMECASSHAYANRCTVFIRCSHAFPFKGLMLWPMFVLFFFSSLFFLFLVGLLCFWSRLQRRTTGSGRCSLSPNSE